MIANRGLGLTPIQLGMVFHQLLDPRSGDNIEQVVITLDASVSAAPLEAAWRAVIARHPVLHSTIVESAPGEYRLVADSGFRPELLGIDPARMEFAAGFDTWLAEDRTRGFDIFAQVPLRLALLRPPGGAVRCVWTFHHILLDGRSFGDVLVDVWDAYDALLADCAPVVPERPSPAPFLAWLGERDHSRSLDYWRQLLAGFEQATPFPAAEVTAAPGRYSVERRLDADLTDAIQRWVLTNEVTLNSVVQAAWATVLARHTDQDTVVFGAARAGRAGHVPEAERMLGVFINTVPVRATVGRCTGLELVRSLRAQQRDGRPHEHVPLARIQSAVHGAGDRTRFQTLLVFDHETLDASVRRRRPGWSDRHFELREQAPYPVALYAYSGPQLTVRLAGVESALPAEQATRVLDHLLAILCGLVAQPTREVRGLPMLTGAELDLIEGEWNATGRAVAPSTIHAAFAQAAALHPQRAALTGAGRTLSYAELDAVTDAVAAALAEHGVQRGAVVGLSVDRSRELVIAMLGILKAGAAYLPLDPAYPGERLEFCVRDSGVRFVVTQQRHAHRFETAGANALLVEDLLVEGVPAKNLLVDSLLVDSELVGSQARPTARAPGGEPGANDDLAYVIYTSGSTGKPKGVLVTHANVVNFFAGMDAVIETGGDAPKRWLAVTSASFDISVLELLWTLTRGFETVVHGARDLSRVAQHPGPSFSLFHFASGMDASDPQPYRLILEAARFADTHGLEAVWSPERHFHDFGAPYPNPSVMNAALATITSRVQLRAGSVVLPLHDPLRVAEEWSLVDQLSHGRVGVSFASGWQPNDFVLAPANYDRRKDLMFEQIETVRALWRGERVKVRNPKGDEVLLGTFPRPVQAELPIWITAAGSPDTFRQAGTIGANILTHLLGQSLDDLAANIRDYRGARGAAGHDPATGRVTVMVHTFIGDDTEQVRELVRAPMKRYLHSAASLVGSYADAWTAFKRGAGGAVGATALNELSVDEQQELYDFAFERYFEHSGLMGSVEKCSRLVASLRGLGVDEIACLIDFGVAPDVVIAHLPYIDRLKNVVGQQVADAEHDLVSDIAAHAITHLQCTPSLASTIPMLADQPDALLSLRQLLVGGEALPPDLVAALHALLPATASIVNMYGPTETTIWSMTERVERDAQRVTIGHPIANTQCYVLDSFKQLVPPGCAGELHIGGDGVARGYHDRPALDAERFFALALDPGVSGQPRRVYATGDLVRQLADGRIEYLGRNDFQVKVRGHRIELGEIEVALRAQPGVVDAVVVAHAVSPGSQVLVGYLVAPRGGSAIEVEALKLLLRRRLPEVMVPNTFVWLDALPLTPNGKIDRQALPGPTVASGSGAPAAAVSAPRSDAEQVIREVWQRVLNLPEIGVRDNFFELGGHSILAIKVQSELSQAFGVHLPIIELFRSPTIEALAAHFSRGAVDPSATATGAGVGKASKRRAAMNRRVALTGGRSHDPQ